MVCRCMKVLHSAAVQPSGCQFKIALLVEHTSGLVNHGRAMADTTGLAQFTVAACGALCLFVFRNLSYCSVFSVYQAS